MKGNVTHNVVDEPATPTAHVARGTPVRVICGFVEHLLAKDSDILEDACLHLLEGRRSEGFRSNSSLEGMLLVINGRHDHLRLEEMAENGEELALLAVRAYMVDISQGRVGID